MLYVTTRFVLASNVRLCLARRTAINSLQQLTATRRLPFSSSNQGSTNPGKGGTTNAKPTELNATFITSDPRMPAKQRLKNLFTVYGPTAVVLHIGLSLTFLGMTYLVVKYGFDVPTFLQRQNLLSEKYMMIIANGGTFALAYALYKAAMPFRVLVTLILTPPVARRLQAYGIIKRKF